MLGILASLAVGTLLIGALKDVLDRPRPGAEFLTPGEGSFPSGHVGNTILNATAIWLLWTGRGARLWPRPLGWLVITVVFGIVAAARVYGRRHWPSDAAAALAIGGAYAALALLHPDPRWRIAATAFGAVLTGAGLLAAASGAKTRFPREPPQVVRSPSCGSPSATPRSRGRCTACGARGEPGPVRRTAWLRAPVGTVDLPAGLGPVGEVRVVARPRGDGRTATVRVCAWR